MRRYSLITLLLVPSLFSGSVAVFLSAATLLSTNWIYSTPGGGMHDYLFGQYGLTTIFQHSSNALAAINGVFSSPLAYNVAVVIFALFIGLLIYVLLESIDHITSKANTVMREVEYINDPGLKHQMKVETELRAGLRVAALVVWVVYFIFFARVLLPFCILLGRIDANNLGTLQGIGGLLGSFVLLLISLHIHTICMRVLVLRPRLFGQTDALVSRGGHEEEV
ncbi:MAG TPA: hypothetical protein VF733_07030 [Candidatus Saccharimonadales bacterium]